MSNHRIIGLIDMDCFYVQCEQRLKPEMWGKPCAVAQYNNWKGGGIIAVNYEARAFGVKRGMRGEDAKELCKDVHIFSVPDENGKAKLDRYRDASAEVFDVISSFIDQEEKTMGSKNLVILERASVDEAFIDLTRLIDCKLMMLPGLEDLLSYNTKLELQGTNLEEWLRDNEEAENGINENNIRLIMGTLIVGKIRQMIYEKTQFRCSAGISHNKMLSKLACGINKPNAQTVLPMEGVPGLFHRIDISDVRMLGGKLGRQIKQVFGCNTMHQLNQVDQTLLAQTFDERTATWLHELSCGIDDEPVSDRRLTKSIGCGKNFRGKTALTKSSDIHHWTKVLLEELYARLIKDRETNKRIAKILVVGYFTSNKGHCSRSIPLDTNAGDYPKPEKMAKKIMQMVFPTTNGLEQILNLSIAATKFLEETSSKNKIDNFFKKIDKSEIQSRPEPPEKEAVSFSKKSFSNSIDKYFKISQPAETVPENIINFDIDNDLVEEKIQDEFEPYMESFFFKKILNMIENNDEILMKFLKTTDHQTNDEDDDY